MDDLNDYCSPACIQMLLGVIEAALEDPPMPSLADIRAAADAAMAAADYNASQQAALEVFRRAGYLPFLAHRFSRLVAEKIRLQRALAQSGNGAPPNIELQQRGFRAEPKSNWRLRRNPLGNF